MSDINENYYVIKAIPMLTLMLGLESMFGFIQALQYSVTENMGDPWIDSLQFLGEKIISMQDFLKSVINEGKEENND